MSAFEYTDPDDGVVYEMRYVVTQSPDEGCEYVEWRISPRMAGSLGLDVSWKRLPPWATPPKEAMEFWHGEIPSQLPDTDGLTMDDINDLFGAVYRLANDLKRIGAIPREFSMTIPGD